MDTFCPCLCIGGLSERLKLARAYLLKDIPRDEFLNHVRAVYNGQYCIPPAVAARLAQRLPFSELSSRELDVLRLIAVGPVRPLMGFLSHREAPVPISMHGDAFLPRYLRLASGEVAPYYNADLTESRIGDLGGRLVLHQGPLEIGPGIIATGEIPRRVEFEAPPTSIDTPNALIQLRDGAAAPDAVPDDQALVIKVGADGIIVLAGCSHAGIINTIRHAIEISGRTRVMGVFGGFHLGFPGVPEQKTHDTIDALREIEVEVLCPMHCTGMAAMMEIRRALPERFLMNCTGSRVYFDETTASIGAAHPTPWPPA